MRRFPHASRLWAAAHVFCVGLWACDEAPLVLGGGDESDDAGEAGVGGGAAGLDLGAGGSAVAPPTGSPLDAASFQANILPILSTMCAGPYCHTGEPPIDARMRLYLTSAAAPVLTEVQLQADLSEIALFVDRANPGLSRLLVYPTSMAGGVPNHPTGTPLFTVGGSEYRTFETWIGIPAGVAPGTAPGTAPATAPPADPGSSSVPCTGLPSPDRSPYDFAGFQVGANPVLRTLCASPACHGTAGRGGGLWLQPGDADCDRRWNFFAAQWFVDAEAASESPLLAKPVAPGHGGVGVFPDPTDLRYQTLLQWIETGIGP